MAGLQITLDKRFKQKIVGKLTRHQFEVGILQDKAHKNPQSKRKGLTSVDGMKVRKKKARSSIKLSAVSRWNRKKVNYLQAPFKKANNPDLKDFIAAMYGFISNNIGQRRVIALLRAVVRNPMRRNVYGPNARSTVRTKGFNRYTIDTGQLYQNIKARITRARV